MIPNAVCKEHDENLGEGTALNSPKLKEAEAIRKLSRALGGKLLHFYVYGAVEGEVLVYYFSHPAILMEFKAQKEVILEEMKQIWKREALKKEIIFFKDIAAKVKPKPAPKQEVINVERDRASGDFVVHGDGAVAAKFKQIAKTIQAKNARYEETRGGSDE